MKREKWGGIKVKLRNKEQPLSVSTVGVCQPDGKLLVISWIRFLPYVLKGFLPSFSSLPNIFLYFVKHECLKVTVCTRTPSFRHCMYLLLTTILVRKTLHLHLPGREGKWSYREFTNEKLRHKEMTRWFQRCHFSTWTPMAVGLFQKSWLP